MTADSRMYIFFQSLISVPIPVFQGQAKTLVAALSQGPSTLHLRMNQIPLKGGIVTLKMYPFKNQQNSFLQEIITFYILLDLNFFILIK